MSGRVNPENNFECVSAVDLPAIARELGPPNAKLDPSKVITMSSSAALDILENVVAPEVACSAAS